MRGPVSVPGQQESGELSQPHSLTARRPLLSHPLPPFSYLLPPFSYLLPPFSYLLPLLSHPLPPFSYPRPPFSYLLPPCPRAALTLLLACRCVLLDASLPQAVYASSPGTPSASALRTPRTPLPIQRGSGGGKGSSALGASPEPVPESVTHTASPEVVGSSAVPARLQKDLGRWGGCVREWCVIA